MHGPHPLSITVGQSAVESLHASIVGNTSTSALLPNPSFNSDPTGCVIRHPPFGRISVLLQSSGCRSGRLTVFVRQPRNMLKSKFQIIILASIFTAFCSLKHTGFILFLFVPFFMVWVVVRSFTSYKNPSTRRPVFLTSCIWILAILIVSIIHMSRFSIARSAANRAVNCILDYKNLHGDFPRTLTVDDSSNDIFYQYENGKPSLFYRSTFAPFSVYIYNFETKQWAYHGD